MHVISATSLDSNFRWNDEARDNLVFSDTMKSGNDNESLKLPDPEGIE